MKRRSDRKLNSHTSFLCLLGTRQRCHCCCYCCFRRHPVVLYENRNQFQSPPSGFSYLRQTFPIELGRGRRRRTKKREHHNDRAVDKRHPDDARKPLSPNVNALPRWFQASCLATTRSAAKLTHYYSHISTDASL